MAVVSAAARGGDDDLRQQKTSDSLHDLHYGVHLPRDRMLARALVVARELIKESRYGESLPVLVRILHAPEDAFENPRDLSDAPLASLKRQAREIIQSLGPEGMRAYRLEVESQAEREFQRAVEQGDEGLADVARRFPRTEAGRLAAWALAQRSLEMGHFSKAATLLARLTADADLNPERRSSAKTQRAIALMALGRVDEARTLLDELSGESDAVMQLLGAPDDVAAADAERLEETATVFASRLRTANSNDGGWLTTGGDAQRNPTLTGEPPHLWARWWAPATAQTPTLLSHAALPSHEPAPAAATNPLLVGPYVVVRSGGDVVGIDRESGKLLWEAPLASNDGNRLPGSALLRLRSDSHLLADLVARPRLDAVASRLSSDGRCVFAISQPDSPDDDPARALGALLGGRSRGWEVTGNQLVVLDAHAEGKLAWRLGGSRAIARSASSDLAGAYFLDVPLAVDSDLFVVAEVQQTIYLLQLRPETGDVLWRQALASVDNAVDDDAMRQMVGAITCYAQGRVIVSLGAGLVVAVDPGERVLDWVYRFPVDGGTRVASPSPWRRRRSASWPNSGKQHWLRNQMLVAGGLVVVASPESQRLHAIDVETGDQAWSSDLPSGRLLCAVAQQHVIVTTDNRVIGVSAESGETRWDASLPDSARPSAAGVCFNDQYVQPLSDGSALWIDATTGQINQCVQLNPSVSGGLGNLAYDGRSLYSQGTDGVARFDRPPALASDRATEAERERFAGEAAAMTGRMDEAAEHFLAAYQSAGEQGEHAAALRDVLLARVSSGDYELSDVQLLGELCAAHESPPVLELARVRAAADQGRAAEVLRRALEFCADGDGTERLIAIAPKRAVLPARGFCGAVIEAFGSSAAARREPAVRDALARTANGGVRAELLAEVFGPFPSPATLGSPPNGVGAPGLDTRWSASQVTAQRRVAGESDDGRAGAGLRRGADGPVFAVPMRREGSSDVDLAALAVFTDGRWLAGVNAYGEEVLRVELPKGSIEGFHKRPQSGGPIAVLVGDWLFMATGADVLALDTRPSDAPPDWSWSARRALQRAALNVHLSAAKSHAALTGKLHSAASKELRLVGASPLGVTVAADDVLACIDPTTGAVQWARAGLAEVEHATADERFVYSPRQISDGWRVSLVDGSVAPCEWPRGKSINVRGALVTLLHRSGNETTIELIDRRRQAVRLSRSFHGAVHHATADGVLAVLDERGRLDVIDLRSCGVRVSTTLDLETGVESISAARFGDRVLVGVHEPGELAGRAESLSPIDSAPLLTGRLYSFDLATGESMWPGPALVAEKGVLARQPHRSPVVALASTYSDRDGSGAFTALNLLMLDAATGRTLYRETGVRMRALREYHMRCQGGPRPRVSLALDTTYVTLTATDAPVAPGPPATATVELAGEASRGDLGWMGRRLGRFLEEGFGIRIEGPRDEDDD